MIDESREPPASPASDQVMVVELLTFAVDPAERDAWMAVEERTWSRFLERQDGFVRKEMWVDRDDPGHVHAAIWWRDEASWKSIPADEQAAVDEAMGPWWRASTCRTIDVLRDR